MFQYSSSLGTKTDLIMIIEYRLKNNPLTVITKFVVQYRMVTSNIVDNSVLK